MSDVPPVKRLFVKTYGCQMNVYDSERMADVLAPHGYGLTDRAEEADLIILNTCHIREKASEKLYSELGRLKPLKVANSGLKVAVAGCVAQAQGLEITARAPVVDLVVGPQSYHRLPELLERDARTRGERLLADFAADEKFDALPRARRPSGVSAFLTVQEGCDKFCTFCVVPYTRGAEYSRPVSDILAEAGALVDQGVRELVLLGQNVNAYEGRTPEGGAARLSDLIARLSALEGLSRIRYTTSHPKDLSSDLVDAHRDLPALMPYLHLPVQSGSDRILKAMNRSHNAAHYADLVARLRQARPDIALSGDFIVGFPGETEADFEATLKLVEAVGYASAFSFKYSARPGTPAAALPGQVPEEEKEARLATLNALLNAQQAAFNSSMVGQVTDVLIERPGRRPGQIVGRTPYLQPIWAPGSAARIGDIVRVRVEASGRGSLVGAALEPARAQETAA